MLKNYLTVASRHLLRHKGYTAINVGGLAVGLASCMVIALFVQDELGFDKDVPDYDRVVRVVEAFETPEGEQYRASTMMPLGETLTQQLAGVEAYAGMMSRSATGRFTVQFGENRFYEGEHLFVGPDMPGFFGLNWQSPDRAEALARPYTVVLTPVAVDRYFGEVDPVGKTLSVERFGDFEVVGVLESPSNAHLQFSMLFSMATLTSDENWAPYFDEWDSQEMLTYLRIASGFEAAAIEEALPATLAGLVDPEILGQRRLLLQPLEEVHFGSAHILFERNSGESDIAYIYLFSAIAIFILAVASINYMNLATARSMRRAKEIGIRKANGASRVQLVRQFLGESTLITMLALVLGAIVVSLFVAPLGVLAGKDLSVDLGTDFALILGLTALAALIGIAAGGYPALYLSAFRPSPILRGAAVQGGAPAFRKLLVGLQFAISVALLSSTLIVYQQMNFVRQTRLATVAQELLIVDINDGGVRRNFETVRQDFRNVPGVESVSVTNNVPGDWKSIPQVEVFPPSGEISVTARFLGVDEAFLDTYGFDLIEGRGFSTQFRGDSLSVVLNQTAARAMGVQVGDAITIPGSELFGRFQNTSFQPRIVGIVSDFHVESLRTEIPPVVIGYRSNPIDVIDYFTIKVAGGVTAGTLQQLQAVGELHDPGHPFEYNYLDERLRDFYVSEQRAARLFGVAALLAIIIACMGLFGLSAFVAERRTKEIGVRKVLGASVPGIVGMLSGGMLWLVLAATAIAVPLVYLAMGQWLSNFVYRVEPAWWVFAAASLATIVVAFATVSYHAIRAARQDPAQSLRYE